MRPFNKIAPYLYGFFIVLPRHRAGGQIKGAYSPRTSYPSPILMAWNPCEPKLQSIKKPPQYWG